MSDNFISFNVETSGFDDVLAHLEAIQQVLGEHKASEFFTPEFMQEHNFQQKTFIEFLDFNNFNSDIDDISDDAMDHAINNQSDFNNWSDALDSAVDAFIERAQKL